MDIYVKGTDAVLISKVNLFIYEVSVYCRYKHYFGLMDSEFYSSSDVIENVVWNYYKDGHTEIRCDFIAAPLTWLLSNGYTKYVKPDKKKIIKKTKITKDVKSKTTIGKSRSWSPNGETDSARIKEFQPL